LCRLRPIDTLKRRITELEQKVVDLTDRLEEHTEDLEAARSANREMMTRLNSPGGAR
jgi:predicted  nucleic acid-binding Zn-ribbon protein